MFVGERRSPTAIRMGVTWTDGRLAAATLHDALRAAGVDPDGCRYLNLFRDDQPDDWTADLRAVTYLRNFVDRPEPYTVVALGKRVATELDRWRIPYLAMTHPAARGRIRKKERYRAHVAAVLSPAEAVHA